jgi:hypothetical protein
MLKQVQHDGSPGFADSSSNCSSVTLNDAVMGDCSSAVTKNIFPSTLKQRSLPHLMSSVTLGNCLHKLCTSSIFITAR